jgi:hypothetical protein
MTSLQMVLSYEGSITEREAQAVSAIRDVYGIWGLKVNEKNHSIIVDYDASRLTPGHIAFLLRNAGIRLANAAPKAA